MLRHLRIARPVTDVDRSRAMYCGGLGFRVIGSFVDHDGFDGVMVGGEEGYHFEFTRSRAQPVEPSPSEEDLMVFYIPARMEWERSCERMLAAGFRRVESFNPYWELRGATFEDSDGYRVVLQQESWTPDWKNQAV